MNFGNAKIFLLFFLNSNRAKLNMKTDAQNKTNVLENQGVQNQNGSSP